MPFLRIRYLCIWHKFKSSEEHKKRTQSIKKNFMNRFNYALIKSLPYVLVEDGRKDKVGYLTYFVEF